MRLQVTDLEQGLAPDAADVVLPDGVFTDARNFQFREGAMEKCKGTTAVFGSLSCTAIWLSSVTDGVNIYWTYANESVVYATDGSVHTKISSLTYSATPDLGYTGGPFNGMMILNDAVAVPQYWNGNTATKITNLSNWPASTYCKVMRPFGSFLVAMRLTEGGVYNPRVLRWSDAATPGALPGSWDYTDPTNQSGRTELGDTQDELVDCLPLRDVNIIYKQNSTWLMQPIGGLDVFAFRLAFSQSGLLSEDCAKPIGAQHFAMTDADIIIHDGSQQQSLLNRRLRRWLVNNIDTTYYKRAFVAADYKERQMWACFPEQGQSYATLAVVYDWGSGKVHIREIGGSGRPVAFGASGIIGSSVVTWNNDTEQWDVGTGAWDEANYSPIAQRLILSGSSQVLAFQANFGGGWNGTNMACYANRSNMALTRDVGSIKRVKAIYPKIYGTAAETITIRVGGSDSPDGSVTYSSAKTFTIGTDYKIDCRISGRYISMTLAYTGQNQVKVAGFDVEFDVDGRR